MFENKISSQKEKRDIIKKIYNELKYSDNPTVSNNQEYFNNNEKLYRGISAENSELLNKYIRDFVNGEPFYGGRASIYGTGIYTVVGNDSNVAKEYATDGEINNCGVIVESVLEKDVKVINSSTIDPTRAIIIKRLEKMYSKEIINYLDLLEDDGLFSAILGYDSIFVEDKKYMVVLNRKKMIVNSKSIDIDNKKENNENYQHR